MRELLALRLPLSADGTGHGRNGLRKINTQASALVAEYRYNGLGFRTAWHYDVDEDGTVENTSDDPWFYFCYDERWRMVATYRSSDSTPKEQFAYHAAGYGGVDGHGSSVSVP